MRSEHLGIGDGTFLINRLIQQAPINTLVREFFKNADENAALAPDGKRTVMIYPTLVDGISMAADDYRQSLFGARKWIKDRIRIANVTALG